MAKTTGDPYAQAYDEGVLDERKRCADIVRRYSLAYAGQTTTVVGIEVASTMNDIVDRIKSGKD